MKLMWHWPKENVVVRSQVSHWTFHKQFKFFGIGKLLAYVFHVVKEETWSKMVVSFFKCKEGTQTEKMRQDLSVCDKQLGGCAKHEWQRVVFWAEGIDCTDRGKPKLRGK